MNILSAALAQEWAMPEDHVRNLLAIAARENEISDTALESYRADRQDEETGLSIRGDVGVINVAGPLFKFANLFTVLSGATSYQMTALALQQAADDPQIRSIVIQFDTPGGMVSGCDELATAIHSARKTKPVYAYVSGMAASAGYWLASSCEKVIISPASMVGSIGVVRAWQDDTKRKAAAGIETIEIVSSQSPDKRPDHSTDEGRSVHQKQVDDLADVFIKSVAENRGVSADQVAKEFGAGGVEIGANAVSKGMADAIGQFEDLIAVLSTEASSLDGAITGGQLVSNNTKNEPAASEPAAPDTKAIADQAKAHVVEVMKAGRENGLNEMSDAVLEDSAFNDVPTASIVGLINTVGASLKERASSSTQTSRGAKDAQDAKSDYADEAAENGAIGAGLAGDEPQTPKKPEDKSGEVWGAFKKPNAA
jgi:signal peptide peptidase SppA